MSNLRFGRRFGVLNPVLAVTVGILSAAAEPAVAEDALVFRDVRVFDGANVIPSTTVVIRAPGSTRSARRLRYPRERRSSMGKARRCCLA